MEPVLDAFFFPMKRGTDSYWSLDYWSGTLETMSTSLFVHRTDDTNVFRRRRRPRRRHTGEYVLQVKEGLDRTPIDGLS